MHLAKKNDDEKGGESEEVSDTEEGTCSMPAFLMPFLKFSELTYYRKFDNFNFVLQI